MTSLSKIRVTACGLLLLLPARLVAEPATSEEMTARVDELLAARWQQEGVQPAPASSDSEFLRRVYLDLTGAVPLVSDARRFLESREPDKRRQLIERLLRSPRHATHMAITWRNRMLPEQFDPGQLQSSAGLQNWLRRQFVNNLRYDNLVADLVASTGSSETGPALYFTSLELKPEKLAASTARIFLGLQIQCAECHNHPFDHWTQEDFWGYAAFFAQLRGGGGDSPLRQRAALVDTGSGEVMAPGSDRPAAPMFPGGQLAPDDIGGTRRQQLAIWIASRDNPYLSRAAVNWAWAHLFGRGLVDPVDDLADHNPPSHPQLMQELSDYFAHNGFDMRDLLRTLCNTRAYQLTSRGDQEPPPQHFFARMAVKTLTAEQFYDSLAHCLAQREQQSMGPPGDNILFDPRRLEFVARMRTQSRSPLEYESGPPQALLLMNGPLSSEATDIERSALLGSLEAPLFTDRQRLETVFLATLSRLPKPEEEQQMLDYLQRAGDQAGRHQALGDVLWAVLNSAEFALNH